LKKYLKYFLKGIAILLGLALILYLVIFIYVSTHKNSIIKQVTEEVGKKLSGNVSIGDVDLSFFATFPNVSVVLHRVIITDSLYQQHHHPFFTGEEVFALLNVARLIKKQPPVKGVKIKNGHFYLFTDTTGYTNQYLFKPKKDSSLPSTNEAQKEELKSIILNNVQFTLDDKTAGKLYDITMNNMNMKLKDKDSFIIFSTKADALIHNLAFNIRRGSFLKEKSFKGNFDLRFDKTLMQLKFDSIDISISKKSFNVSGSFDMKGPAPQFEIRIHTKNIDYAFAKSLLTPKINKALSVASIENTLNADAYISGPVKGANQLVRIDWNVKNAALKTNFSDFDHASFSGSFNNEVKKGLPRLDPNSGITINHFSGKWNGLPVYSNNIQIFNLEKPILSCDLQSDFSLAGLNDLLGSNNIRLKTGDCSIKITYHGPLQKSKESNSFVNGVVTFKKGTILYVPRNVEMKNANGRLVIRNSNVVVENLKCDVLGNKLVMNGHANDLMTLINTQPDKVNINWNIYSPSLNLSSFIYLLKSTGNRPQTDTKENRLNKIGEKIDRVLNDGIINVKLNSDELRYKKFVATNVTADISLLQNQYLINKVSMQQASGSIALSGSLVDKKINFHQANILATLTNVDVNKLFYAFNNFGQSGIGAENIAGKLSALVNASLGLDDNGRVYPGTVVGTVEFSLKDGRLINFEPIKKIQKVVFKNRNFDDINFAELKDKLEISNGEIKINKMEIASTVFLIFVEGIYSMRGNTDLSIEIPLSNLKKRKADYKPENNGIDNKKGSSIFLRGRPGQDGKIQFKPDLFNKFGKSKAKENEKVN